MLETRIRPFVSVQQSFYILVYIRDLTYLRGRGWQEEIRGYGGPLTQPLLPIKSQIYISEESLILSFLQTLENLKKKFPSFSLFLGNMWVSNIKLLVLSDQSWNSWTLICQKTRVFFSMLFISVSTGGFLKKTRVYSGFKNTGKKIRQTRKLEPIHK